jgi:hypothetical protein
LSYKYPFYRTVAIDATKKKRNIDPIMVDPAATLNGLVLGTLSNLVHQLA